MEIEITVLKSFVYKLKIKAIYKDGSLKFKGQLSDCMLSYFDSHKDYTADTIEKVVEMLAVSIEEAIKQTDIFE